MKKSAYRSALLIAATIMLSATTSVAQTATKNFSKTFPVKTDQTVVISNRYGDVTVEPWNRNEVSIEVIVSVEMPTGDRADRLISQIDVLFFENDTAVGAKTVLDERFSVNTRGIGTSRFSIDYTVKMPAKMAIDLSNRYGHINMAEHSGHVNIDLRYGNLAAYRFTRGNEKPINNLTIHYGKATIDEINWMSITSRYVTGFNIVKAQALLLDSRYSKFTIDEAGSIVTDTKYDNFSIPRINNFVAEGAYTTYKIGTLTGKLNLDTKYGSCAVDYIPAGFESLKVDASYCSITMGIDRAAEYRLDARVSYGSLTYCEECTDITRRIIEGSTREIAGVAGRNSNPSATVSVKSAYGAVRLR